MSHDISENNIGKMLQCMSESISEWIGNKKRKMKVHLQVIEDYHCGYHADEHYHYICEGFNLGLYLGHALNIRKY